MINSEKIIEMNTEELDQISGGIKLSDDQKEKIKKVIEKARIALLIAIPFASVTVNVLAMEAWVTEAVKKGKDIGLLQTFIMSVLLGAGGIGIGATADLALKNLSFRI